MSPKSDRNRLQLETTARNLPSSYQVGATRAVGSDWAVGRAHSCQGSGKLLLALEAGPGIGGDMGALPHPRARVVCTRSHTGVPIRAMISRFLFSCVLIFSMSALKTGFPGPSNSDSKPQIKRPTPTSRHTPALKCHSGDTVGWHGPVVSVTVTRQHSESSRRLPCPTANMSQVVLSSQVAQKRRGAREAS